MRTYLCKQVSPRNYVPLLFLGICIAAFGLFIPFLGYYWDDWLTLYMMKASPHPWGFIYASYRPLHAILDVVEFRILGSNPLGWHVLSLSLRWVSVVLVWRLMRRVSPSAEQFATWVAIFFAIYPSFHQQSSALIYRQHWTTYIFFLLSLLIMIESAHRKASQKALLIVAGVAATLGHLLTTEYLIGLEAIRPLILWVTIPRATNSWRLHLQNVIRYWLPYLLVGIGFITWRLFFLQVAEEPNSPVLVFQMLENPVKALYGFLQTVIQDVVAILWSAWADLLKPSLFDLTDRIGPLIWVSVLASVPILYIIFKRLGMGKQASLDPMQIRELFLVGAAALLFGLATIWLVGRQTTVGLYSDRLTIPAMLGASILVALVIFGLVPKQTHRNLVLALMVSFAIGAHLREANLYRLDWDKQRALAWQFRWRAPALKPGTLVIGNGALASYLDEYNAGFALNLWYLDKPSEIHPKYWYESFYSSLLLQYRGALSQSVDLNAEFYGIRFAGNTAQSLMFFHSSAVSPCWWFLTPEDENNDIIDPDMAASIYSGPENVALQTTTDSLSLTEIFGDEPEANWCMVFQKASLARQFKDWQMVLELWKQAQQEGHRPYNGYELLPFIDAYVYSGQSQAASDLSHHAYQISPKAQSMLCAAWEKYSGFSQGVEGFASAYKFIINRLNCSET